jgi:hypothetical protein
LVYFLLPKLKKKNQNDLQIEEMGVFCANNWPYGDRASKLLFVSSDITDSGRGYGFQAILHNSMMGQFMVCVLVTVLNIRGRGCEGVKAIL